MTNDTNDWVCFLCNTTTDETFDGVCWNCRWTSKELGSMTSRALVMMVAKRGGYRDTVFLNGLVIIIEEE